MTYKFNTIVDDFETEFNREITDEQRTEAYQFITQNCLEMSKSNIYALLSSLIRNSYLKIRERYIKYVGDTEVTATIFITPKKITIYTNASPGGSEIVSPEVASVASARAIVAADGFEIVSRQTYL